MRRSIHTIVLLVAACFMVASCRHTGPTSPPTGSVSVCIHGVAKPGLHWIMPNATLEEIMSAAGGFHRGPDTGWYRLFAVSVHRTNKTGRSEEVYRFRDLSKPKMWKNRDFTFRDGDLIMTKSNHL